MTRTRPASSARVRLTLGPCLFLGLSVGTVAAPAQEPAISGPGVVPPAVTEIEVAVSWRLISEPDLALPRPEIWRAGPDPSGGRDLGGKLVTGARDRA